MYKRESNGLLKHLDFVLWDALCLQVAYVFAHALAGHGFDPYDSAVNLSVAVCLLLADFITVMAYGTMKNVLRRGHFRNFVITLYHSLIVGAITVLYLFLTKQGQAFSRLAMVLTICIYIPLSYLVREFWKAIVLKYLVKREQSALLVVTAMENAEQTIATLAKREYDHWKTVGLAIIDADMVGKQIGGVDVVANADSAPNYVCHEWVDEVLIVLPDALPYPETLIERLRETGVTIHLNLAHTNCSERKNQIVERMGEYTVLTTSIHTASAFQLMLKRLMDIVGGLVGCLFTGIIFLFIAPAIYIASPGNVFFAQERVGKNGKKFKMYKFRSMYLDAEARKAELMKDNKMSDGKMFKLDFDPRVIGNRILPDGTKKTGVGDFIRRTSLDEFPQFFNVLKGDMSIVGVGCIIETTKKSIDFSRVVTV